MQKLSKVLIAVGIVLVLVVALVGYGVTLRSAQTSNPSIVKLTERIQIETITQFACILFVHTETINDTVTTVTSTPSANTTASTFTTFIQPSNFTSTLHETIVTTETTYIKENSMCA